MVPRASWKGFLNLSLVSVPVKAYSSSNSGSQIRLNQLCSECNSRIRQKTICPVCGDLERSDIVKGYEYAKDQYVVIDLEEMDKLRAPDEGKAIKIDTFIDPDRVDPIHFSESSYYLLPDGAAGQKSYTLLHPTMSRKNLCCVAKVVLHNKEQLVLVRALDSLLCMTVLRYANQIKSTSAFDDERVEADVSDSEYELAATLIAETTSDEFDLARYHDQYTERLTQVIEAKVAGEEIVEAPAADSPSVINLMEALKASVAKAQQTKPARRSPKKAAATMKQVAKAKKKTNKSKSSKALADSLAAPSKQTKKATRKKKTG
jgi:DNA end-binding protein Ku